MLRRPFRFESLQSPPAAQRALPVRSADARRFKVLLPSRAPAQRPLFAIASDNAPRTR